MKRIFKYGTVGLWGLVVNEGFLWFFTEFVGFYYLISSLIAIEASIISNFFLNNYWTFSDVKNYINEKIKSLVDTSDSQTSTTILQTDLSKLDETMQPILDLPKVEGTFGSSSTEDLGTGLSTNIISPQSLPVEPEPTEDTYETELKRLRDRVAQSEAAVTEAKAAAARLAPQETSERTQPSGSQDTDSESEAKHFTLNTNITTLISEMIDHLGVSQKSILQFEQILNFIVLYIRLNLLLIINNISSEKEKHEAKLDNDEKEAARVEAERRATARATEKAKAAAATAEVKAARGRARAWAAEQQRQEKAVRETEKAEAAAEAKAKAEWDKKAVSRDAMDHDQDPDNEETLQEAAATEREAAARTMQQYRRKQLARKEKAREAERQSQFHTTWQHGDSGPSTQPAAAPSPEPP